MINHKNSFSSNAVFNVIENRIGNYLRIFTFRQNFFLYIYILLNLNIELASFNNWYIEIITYNK